MIDLAIFSLMNNISSMIMGLTLSSMAADRDKWIAEMKAPANIETNVSVGNSETNKIKETYREILNLVLKNSQNRDTKCIPYFNSLKEVVQDFPQYSKDDIDSVTKDLYEKARRILNKKNDTEALAAMASCTDVIFNGFSK